MPSSGLDNFEMIRKEVDMARNKKSSEVANIIRDWERRGLERMTLGQRQDISNYIMSMGEEELIRLSTDRKKPMFMVIMARALLSEKSAFDCLERIVDRVDGKPRERQEVELSGANIQINFAPIDRAEVERKEQEDAKRMLED